MRIVGLPMNRVGGLNKLMKTVSILEQQLQREPTTEELAEAIGVNEDEIALAGSTWIDVSVDAPFKDDEPNSLLEPARVIQAMKCPDSELMSESLKIEIQRALSKLTLPGM